MKRKHLSLNFKLCFGAEVQRSRAFVTLKLMGGSDVG